MLPPVSSAFSSHPIATELASGRETTPSGAVTLSPAVMKQISIAGFFFRPLPEPKVAPSRVTAKAVLSSEMDVSWEPVEQGDTNGVLLGYEVREWKG